MISPSNPVWSIFPSRGRVIHALLGLALIAMGLAAAPARATVAPAVPQHFYTDWIQQYDQTSGESQDSTAVALDSRGNVIVTGYYFKADNTGNRYIYTAKYDELDGHVVWSGSFVASGDALANSVAVDSQDDVYVGGGAFDGTANELFYLAKYSGEDGSLLWSQTYDGTADGQNEIRKVIVDPNDNVIVTGISAGVSNDLDFETIKYNSSGTVQWSQRRDYDHQDDVPSGLACDGTGNVYVAGSVTNADGDQTFLTVRYTAAGAVSWPATTGTYTSPGEGYGATSVATDSGSDAIVTGHYTDASSNDGFYTVKYDTSGNVLWDAVFQSGSGDDHAGGATSVAVDGNDDVIVTGALNDPSTGVDSIYTVKYASGGFFGNGFLEWPGTGAIIDTGSNGGPAHAVQVTTDGGNNAIVVGDAGDVDGYQDIYVAKYDQSNGNKIWFASYTGTTYENDAFGKAIATDANGNIAITGVPWRDYLGTGRQEIATIKYARLLLETNDVLPTATGLVATPTIFAIDPPALADSGGFATLVTVNNGTAKPTAILTEDSGGGLQLPAVQKTAAAGVSPGTYSLFSDPVIAPDGRYAFAGKIAGVPAANANAVWSDIDGTLTPVLQEGKPVPGLSSVNVATIESIAMRDNQILALLKVSGTAADSSLLLGINSSLVGTPLVRSGQGITIGGTATTVKTITTLSPTVLSPGDGRWQGDANTVVKILTANGVTAICKVTTAGALTPMLYTSESASSVVTGSKWKSFGLPATNPAGTYYTTLGTLAPLTGSVTTANDTALVFSSNGTTFSSYLQEGGTPTDSTLTGLKFTGLTDPLIDTTGNLATIVSLTGPGVTAKNKQALLYGDALFGLENIARLGNGAPDTDGNPTVDNYASFVLLALPSGIEPAPIFVAKIAGTGVTAKNDMGLWSFTSDGIVRRLLRTGDVLGTRTVASFTVLKTPSKSFAAARNFNATAQVAVMVNFTDKTEGLVTIGIP